MIDFIIECVDELGEYYFHLINDFEFDYATTLNTYVLRWRVFDVLNGSNLTRSYLYPTQAELPLTKTQKRNY